MKSCLGILLAFSLFITVIGGGALLWYLSSTVEYSRRDKVPTHAVPKAAVKARPGVQ